MTSQEVAREIARDLGAATRPQIRAHRLFGQLMALIAERDLTVSNMMVEEQALQKVIQCLS